ncbi:LysR family transcriptional regulator [Roseomonas sp. BN140053]|uniref:LysR family transcriptional regulator n=1 Tax=Roseomonas sp. BN140053 TaxID=3391898 RepID=UPI0039E80285
MTFRQIEAYWAVMRTGSVTAAAQLLHVSQPAISKTIRQAEDRLKVTLFHRIRGRLVPSPEAEALFPEVEGIFRRIEALQDRAGELRSLHQGTIRIGASSGLASSVLPLATAAFRRAHPKVQVIASLLPAADLIDKLQTGDIEVGLTLTAIGRSSVMAERIGSTRMVCVLPEDHPLAELDVLCPSDLANYPLISFGADTIFGRALDRAFRAHGVRRQTAIQVELSFHACTFVQCGCGVALVDTLMTGTNLQQVAWRPFEPLLRFPIHWLTAADRPLSQATTAFRPFVVSALAKLGHAADMAGGTRNRER